MLDFHCSRTQIELNHQTMEYSPSRPVPFYQPITDHNKNVVGVEVLARYFDSNEYRSFHFNELTRDHTLAIDIEILESVVNEFPEMARKDLTFVSFNLTPVEPSWYYCQILLDTIKEAQKNNITIWIEIPEHTPLHPSHLILLQQLKNHPVKIAFDDFGTKESQFQRLLSMECDVVKFDRQLLLQATKNNYSLSMFKKLVGYFQSIGKEVVCEGIETEEQLALVISAGFDFIQGYALGKPAPHY
ncbi:MULTISPECIES: EAL domain-containing protein [unclassified Vibrio]|uniref:EAL domain-containing protein n=1 Tax=unclassified Vibrio TaxID=2614977 RepID=UPI000B8EC6D4|nr:MULTISPECIES: EAL domain-containing protein [unclassified Vibrio]NAX17606.1 EAL domain-containing protein [Vibrio sp. V22_P2S10T140]OXX65655.1 hypothetical protein B9J82_02350 [Vibrio sp. V10_P2A27P122]PSD43270.1 EAL domain-containing protein [Vibrio sp. V02_P2A34T13]